MALSRWICCSEDICTTTTGPTCDFTYTGYRVPLIVVSPYAKKNYVSHTITDYTAILKLIETRFNVPALTKRDAASIDMTEFFNFASPPWMTPPTPPPRTRTGRATRITYLKGSVELSVLSVRKRRAFGVREVRVGKPEGPPAAAGKRLRRDLIPRSSGR